MGQIVLTVGSSHEAKLVGFKYFWLKHVVAYDLTRHCARCIIGPYEKATGLQMQMGRPIQLGTGTKYLCGVSRQWATNFHCAVEFAEGERVEKTTFRGQSVVFENAHELPFPALPDGFEGRTKAFTTCRNFQFAVHRKAAIASSM